MILAADASMHPDASMHLFQFWCSFLDVGRSTQYSTSETSPPPKIDVSVHGNINGAYQSLTEQKAGCIQEGQTAIQSH